MPTVPPLTQILADITGHQYLALALVLLIWVRTLLSPSSKFFITISPKWLPTVTASFGLAIGVVGAEQAGAAWTAAVLSGVVLAIAGGLLDGLIVAIWGDPTNAPAWAKWLVMLADEIASGGGSASWSGSGSGAAPSPKPVALVPPANHRAVIDVKWTPSRRAGAWLARPIGACFFALLLAACASLTASGVFSDLQSDEQCVATDLEKGVTSAPQIASDCKLAEEQTAWDIIAALLDSAKFTSSHPTVVVTMTPKLSAHRAALVDAGSK